MGKAVGEAGAQLQGLRTRVCENLALRGRQSLWDLPLLWGPLISRPLPTLAVLSCGSWGGLSTVVTGPHHSPPKADCTPFMAQRKKSPPSVQETQVRSLGGDDPSEEGMAAGSSILAWRIPWTEEPGGHYSP